MLTSTNSIMAQTESDSTVLRPVWSAYTLSSGSSHIADTYLSPIKYAGWTVGFGYNRLQSMKFSPERWIMQLRFNLDASCSKNQAKNTDIWYAGINFSWGMMYRWKLPYGLSAGVGGSAMIDLGCLYLSRNGNNPASAKAAATLNATGYITYKTHLWSLPITLRYQPTLPVIGAFFSPDYNELYYEIFLGNRSGLAHCAWFGNFFRLDNLLTADLNFGNTSLRIGYSANFHSTKVNDIVTHNYTHCAIVGISGEWISLNPNKRISPAAKIISATF
ncbi:MAG: DUF3316 domain-containing protein [Paramuribaculum sp.]|nr:DUF3316 domain-containing protein [Paramuribaculum sp.]